MLVDDTLPDQIDLAESPLNMMKIHDVMLFVNPELQKDPTAS